MNDLSKLIYLGNVAENLGFPLGFMTFILFFVFIFLCAVALAWHSETINSAVSVLRDEIRYSRSEETITKAFDTASQAFKVPNPFTGWTVFSGLAFVVTLTLAVLVPTKDTVYAIAASEMGEEALKTPTAQKAFKAIDAWLDKQIANNQPEQKAE